MFKSLYEFYSSRSKSSKSGGEPSDEELKLAAATLMFEVVRSDGKIERVELLAMGEILRHKFELSDEDIAIMMELARRSSDDATSLQGFTRDICERWGNAKRVKLLEHLWVISLADKTIDSHERHTVRKIASLLYLTEMQIVQAKENAKAKMGIDDFA